MKGLRDLAASGTNCSREKPQARKRGASRNVQAPASMHFPCKVPCSVRCRCGPCNFFLILSKTCPRPILAPTHQRKGLAEGRGEGLLGILALREGMDQLRSRRCKFNQAQGGNPLPLAARRVQAGAGKQGSRPHGQRDSCSRLTEALQSGWVWGQMHSPGSEVLQLVKCAPRPPEKVDNTIDFADSRK